MTSQYYTNLDESSKTRYKAKLTYKGAELPDPLDETVKTYVFTHNMQLWPRITFGDIYMYLVEKECTFSREKMRNYKALDAYNYVLSGRVGAIAAYKNAEICVLTSEVQGGQSINKFHQCWVTCNTNGVIISGHCTCMAGLGEVCSHVAAILFAVEFVSKDNPCPTSQSCSWNVTRKKVDPVPVAALNFSRKRKTAAKFFKKSKLPSESAYDAFFQAVKKYRPDAPFIAALTDDEETSTASESEEEEAKILNFIDRLSEQTKEIPKSVVRNSPDSVLMNIKVSSADAVAIENMTRDQAANKIWSYQRKGRLTASLFGKVLRCKTGHNGLVAQILGNFFSNSATEWGIKYEICAKEKFKNYLAEQHVNGQLLPCGFSIDIENPFLGATPDGFVMCDCCESALLEVKCPARGKGLTIKEIPLKNFFLDVNLNLKKNHPYYDQVQGQMDICKLNRCYLVTCTDIDFCCQIIEFDENYWASQKPVLKHFFKKHVLPKILNEI